MSHTNEDSLFWKRLNRCIYCHEKDAYTISGRAACFECAEKSRLQGIERMKNPEYREKQKETKERRKEKLIALGVCIYCGKRPASDGFSGCEFCRAKRRNYYINKYAQNHGGYKEDLLDKNICTQCRKATKIPGKNVCEQCYERCCQLAWMGKKAQGPPKLQYPLGNNTKAMEIYHRNLERWNAEYGVDRYEDRASNKKQGAGA